MTSHRATWALVAWVLATGALACSDAATPRVVGVLAPPVNPIPQSDPLWSPAPHRDRPRALCLTPDGRRAFVLTLIGGAITEEGECDAARAQHLRRKSGSGGDRN